MEHDAIIAGLRASNAKPALAEAVGHADALAPAVCGLAGKFCEGIHLLPADSDLLFNGLHVLAAARHPGLCDHLIEIARQPDDELNQLFPDHAPISLARLILSVGSRRGAAVRPHQARRYGAQRQMGALQRAGAADLRRPG
jgi:hypothetical protein